MRITYDGLVAGVQFLQTHCEGFDDGTGDDFQTPFIRDLLAEVFRVSGITPEMPKVPQYAPVKTASADYPDTGRLVVFAPEIAALDCGLQFCVHQS